MGRIWGPLPPWIPGLFPSGCGGSVWQGPQGTARSDSDTQDSQGLSLLVDFKFP